MKIELNEEDLTVIFKQHFKRLADRVSSTLTDVDKPTYGVGIILTFQTEEEIEKDRLLDLEVEERRLKREREGIVKEEVIS